MAECSLAKARRSVEDYVVKCFATKLGSLDEDAEVFDYFRLSAEVFESYWTKCLVYDFFVRSIVKIRRIEVWVLH